MIWYGRQPIRTNNIGKDQLTVFDESKWMFSFEICNQNRFCFANKYPIIDYKHDQ